MLNRAALIVRSKQPYLDWAAQLDNSGITPDVKGEQTVYLIPEFEDDEHATRIPKRVFSEVFERKLFEWHTDESSWPSNCTLRLFQEWFDYELHSVVEDLCSFAIVEDEA